MLHVSPATSSPHNRPFQRQVRHGPPRGQSHGPSAREQRQGGAGRVLALVLQVASARTILRAYVRMPQRGRWHLFSLKRRRRKTTSNKTLHSSGKKRWVIAEGCSGKRPMVHLLLPRPPVPCSLRSVAPLGTLTAMPLPLLPLRHSTPGW